MIVRILIADHHKAFREGVRAIIEREPNFKVVGEVGDGRSAVAIIDEVTPNVILMDVSMPVLNGIEATRLITQEKPSVRVIGISSSGQKREVLQMLEAGASGFVLKTNSTAELLQAIRAVARQQSYLCPEVANTVVGICVGRHTLTPASSYQLSGREREVLQTLAEGMTSRQIGAAMHISVKTVEAHRRNIMGKLDLHSVAELTKYAVREGLTAP